MAAALSDPFNATWEVTFEELGGSTRMTMHLAANLSGARVLVAPLVEVWARRVQRRGLESFKADLESR